MFIHESKDAIINHVTYADGASDDRVRITSEGLDYIAETNLTASNTFRCDHIGRTELRWALEDFISAANTLDKYKKAMFRQRSRLESKLSDVTPPDPLIIAPEFEDLFHGIIGVCTEAGEGAEILNKYLLTGSVDMINVSEEAGDLLWYLSRLVKFLRSSFLTIMRQNIQKLRARHGVTGFNREADITRNLEAERKTLENLEGIYPRPEGEG